MRASVHNLGCKTNAYETEAMEEALKKAGYEIVAFNKDTPADVYVINTCSVTNIADRKSRQMLHRARVMNPESVVVAVGCFVQANAATVIENENVDICLGTNNKSMLVDCVNEFLKDRSPIMKVDDVSRDTDYEYLESDSVPEHTRAVIKIQDGCDQFCTYCIIPYVRGRVRSRSIEDIVKEASRLAGLGIKEIVLSGINMSAYGIDMRKGSDKQKIDVGDVINELQKVDGIERIRISSVDPQIISRPFLEKIRNAYKLCPHFHLSLQSGCDGVLSRMNRGYTSEQYMKKCELIREFYSEPSLTTDIIAGFPGETDEEFQETLRFVKKIDFLDMHVFQFSPREGTPAAKMADQVSSRTSKLRSAVLINAASKMTEAALEKNVGSIQYVLIEECVNIGDRKFICGHTERYVKVFIELEEDNKIIETSYEKNMRMPDEAIGNILAVTVVKVDGNRKAVFGKITDTKTL